jgi:hypothetical protein
MMEIEDKQNHMGAASWRGTAKGPGTINRVIECSERLGGLLKYYHRRAA